MDNPPKRTFRKSERLCSKKVIDALFAGGNKSFSAYPLRVVYMENSEPGVKVLISVSKRHFKHAVDRNRVKRQIREAYRNNKDILSAEKGFNLAFIWLSDETSPSDVVASRIINLLTRIKEDD